nr:hypothetical protein [Mesorhizobium sp.]
MPGSHKLAGYDNIDIGKTLGALQNLPHDGRDGPCRSANARGRLQLSQRPYGAWRRGQLSRRRRIAMTAAFMPDGSIFNGRQNILPTAYFESLNVGDRLCDDTINPIVGRA